MRRLDITANRQIGKKLAFSGWARGAALLLALSASLDAVAARMYRFTNADGEVEMGFSIPADRVKYGYQVLDQTGRVLQTVAPQLSAADARAKRERLAAIADCQRDQAKVDALYQSEEDIDYAKKQALESIDEAISHDEANLTHARNQQVELLEQAAQLERSGRRLNSVIMGNVERADLLIDNLERSLEQRHEEKSKVEERYEHDRKVFLQPNCETLFAAQPQANPLG